MELGYKPPREEASRQWVGGVTQMQLKSRRTPEKPQENGKGDGARLGADIKFYRPGDKEPFMNERQREYFRLKLLVWREDILKEAKRNPPAPATRKPESPRPHRPCLLGNGPGY